MLNVSLLKQLLDYIRKYIRYNQTDISFYGQETGDLYEFTIIQEGITLKIKKISVFVRNATKLHLPDKNFTIKSIVETTNNKDGKLYERREIFPQNIIPLWISLFKTLGDKVDLRFVDRKTGKRYLGRHCKGKVLLWEDSSNTVNLFIGTMYKLAQWNTDLEIESFGPSANKNMSNVELINSIKTLAVRTNKEYIELKI